MPEKSWIKSKTIWVNVVAIVFVYLFRDSMQITPEVQLTGLAVLNIILRFVTSQSITLKLTAELTTK